MKFDLRSIKRRVDAATPGEWKLDRQNVYSELGGEPQKTNVEIFSVSLGDPSIDSKMGTNISSLRLKFPKYEDLEFIAHARTDVPALVEEVERLQEIERLWEQACDDAKDRDL